MEDLSFCTFTQFYFDPSCLSTPIGTSQPVSCSVPSEAGMWSRMLPQQPWILKINSRILRLLHAASVIPRTHLPPSLQSLPLPLFTHSATPSNHSLGHSLHSLTPPSPLPLHSCHSPLPLLTHHCGGCSTCSCRRPPSGL